jgi:hypothetical protein
MAVIRDDDEERLVRIEAALERLTREQRTLKELLEAQHASRLAILDSREARGKRRTGRVQRPGKSR